MGTKKVKENSKIKVHFNIRLEDGTIADDTQSVGKPIEFYLNQGVFPTKLEEALLGLEAGSKKNIMLLPEDAFGHHHPANVYQMPYAQFNGTEVEGKLEVGMIVMFTQPSGKEIPGIVRELNDQEVTIDFNHPLSGQVVLFQVSIVDVVT